MPCLSAMYHTSRAHRGDGVGRRRRLLRREALARGSRGDDGCSRPPPRGDPPRRAHDPLRRRGRPFRAAGGGRASRGRRARRRRPLLRQVVRHGGRGRAALVGPGPGHAGALAPERRRQRRQDRRAGGSRAVDGRRRADLRDDRGAGRHPAQRTRAHHFRRAGRPRERAGRGAARCVRAGRDSSRAVQRHSAGALGEIHPALRRRRNDRPHARDARCRPRHASDLAPVPRARRGGHGSRARGRGDPAGRHGRPDPEGRRVHSSRQSSLARPGPAAGQTARARSSARVCSTPRRAPRGGDACRLRRLRGPPAARGGEARLTSPARAAWRYVWHYRARYGIGVACLGTATLASLTIPWTVKRAIDALQADPASAPVGHYVALIALFAIVNGVARLGSRFAITGGCQRIESDIRDDLYAALQTFPPRFYAAHSTGDLMARSTSDITAVRSPLGFGTISLVSTAFAFVGVLVAMLAVDPWLTLWALAPYPFLVHLARRFKLKVNDRAQAAQDQLSVLSERVQEYLGGMAVVRAYTLEPRARADFGRANGEYLRLSLALARTEAGFSPLMGLIAGIGTLVVLWAGGRAVVDGRLSLGALVAFNGYLAYLTWPTIALGWTLSIVRRGLTSMSRIQEIVVAAGTTDRTGVSEPASAGVRPPSVRAGLTDPATTNPASASVRPPSVRAGLTDPATTNPASASVRPPSVRAGLTDPATTTPAAPQIRFSHLTFAYGERAPALRDVSFEVGPGETVAVVGPTGSGKSTLGLLLARLWEPPGGTLFLDGRDVTEIPLATLRAGLGYVPQDGFLFSRSIAENIALGRDNGGAAQVRAAASVAGIAEEVERFPAGFDAVVGERGLTLSGGQRQRVTLARALAGAPPALVLDDAFASVDAAKEEEILINLRRVVSERTVLLMTHRLRAACTADRIVVLDAGRVVETGGHEELLRRGGLYARLWRIQQLEEEIARA